MGALADFFSALLPGRGKMIEQAWQTSRGLYRSKREWWTCSREHIYRLGGIAGIDPRPFTFWQLRELAYGRNPQIKGINQSGSGRGARGGRNEISIPFNSRNIDTFIKVLTNGNVDKTRDQDQSPSDEGN